DALGLAQAGLARRDGDQLLEDLAPDLLQNSGGVKMTKQFEGKVALVTGAASGIGRASALAFAREAAKTVVADVLVEGGEETVRIIKEAGGDALLVRTDVSKAAEVETLIQKIVETYGQLDYA